MKGKKAHALCHYVHYASIHIFACYMKMKVMMRLKSDNEESLLVDKKSMWIGYGLLKQSTSDEKI